MVIALWGCNQGGSLEDSFAPDPRLSQQPTVLGEDTPRTETPKGFPPEIPLYPGATLIQSDDNSTVWAIADNVSQLETFYRDTLAQSNWAFVEPEEPSADFQQIVATKDNLEINVAIPVESAPEPETSEQAVVGTTFVVSYEVLAIQPQLNSAEPPAAENTEEPISETPKTTEAETEKKTLDSDTGLSDEMNDLIVLDVFSVDDFQANEAITRRQFARWLFTAHNKIYGDRPNQQIRVASNSSNPVFQDVSSNDKDFEIIQGLAEAGLIPSTLTSDANPTSFRPDAQLTRETLITWKVPLDRRKALPDTTLEQIAETWGFQDAAEIDFRALQALYVDFLNGDQSNTRRVFGYTTLFQPKKTVTQQEAAIALWYFGFQSDGLSAADVTPQ